MPTHTYLFKPTQKYYQKCLKNLLNFHQIPYAESEIKSYNKSELKHLIHKYRITYRKSIYNPNNSWYKTSYIY